MQRTQKRQGGRLSQVKENLRSQKESVHKWLSLIQIALGSQTVYIPTYWDFLQS